MSLLNKMLRDLEHRRETAQEAVPGVKAVDPAPPQRTRIMVLLGVLGIGGAAAALLTHDLPGFWRPSSEGVAGVAPKVQLRQAISARRPEVVPASVPQVTLSPAAAAVAAPQMAPEEALLRELHFAHDIALPIGSSPAGVPEPASARTGNNAVSTAESSEVESASKPAAGSAAEVVAKAAAGKPRARSSVPDRHEGHEGSAQVGGIEVNMRQPDARQRAHEAVESGLQAMARKQYAEAQRAFRAALELDSHDDRARQALLSTLLAQEEKQAAEVVADDGMINGVSKVGFALVSARLKLERGAVKEALAVLERERGAGAAHADYLAMWGNALSREARYGEAVRMYASAVELAPTNPAHHVGLGYALRNDGQFAASQAVFQGVAEMPGVSPQLAELIDQQLSSLRRLVVSR